MTNTKDGSKIVATMDVDWDPVAQKEGVWLVMLDGSKVLLESKSDLNISQFLNGDNGGAAATLKLIHGLLLNVKQLEDRLAELEVKQMKRLETNRDRFHSAMKRFYPNVNLERSADGGYKMHMVELAWSMFREGFKLGIGVNNE